MRGRYRARVRYPYSRQWHEFAADDLEDAKAWLGREIMRDPNLIEGQLLDDAGYLPLIVVQVKHRSRRNG